MSEVKISALPPASSANPSDIFPIVQGGVTKQLPISAILSSAKDKSVSHLKALPATPTSGVVYSVIGFYSGSTAGGGLFVFNPDGDKSTHNGVKAYAPEALQAWAGTQADIATLLNWTGVGSGVWVRILNGFVTPEMAGAVGDGSNENDSLQKALNISQNSLFILAGGKNYGFTQLEIKGGTTIVSNSSTFTRMSPSTAHGMIINDNVSVDVLSIFSQGGPTGDRAILLKGGNFKAGCVSVYAASEGSFTSVNWAMEIDSGSAEVLSNIAIDCFKVINYRCAMFAKRVNGMIVNDITVQFYQLAFYLQDCQDVSMDVASISGLSTTLTGNPGENGILMESTYSNASNNIRISNWHVKDSGEHGYRMGGQFTISDVYFENCISTRPGRAGYVAWPLASEWHGGCGFKVLGGTSTTGQRHKNIHLNNCTVIDCDINPTFGIGHGINNFTAYQVFVCEDVFITDCKVKNSGSQAYSALQGMVIGATNNIHISNFDCDATERPALKLQDEPPTSAGWSFGINGLYINGAVLRVRAANVAVIYAESVRYSHSDWKLKNINCYGGRSAIRLETPSTGSHPTDALVDLSYQGSDSDEATVTTPIVTGSRVFRAAVTAPWRVMATDPSFKDGTFYTDTITGNIRIRKSGSWNVL